MTDNLERERIRIRDLRARFRTQTPTVHGRSTYDNYGCRCPICTRAKSQANTEYWRRYILNRVRSR